jgi:predicted nucleotidyltransferase
MRPALPHWKRSAANITGGNTVLNPDFREFIGSLNDNGVKYLVVGGYAVAFHGHPRYTKDLDIWIQVSAQNASNVIKALKAFGFGSLGLTEQDFLIPDQVVQLGYPPNRIDLIALVDGIDFDECYPAHIETEIDGVFVKFIDLENLKKNKKASGRLQDLADLENLA